mgnify:CR=1 FL=1
MKNPVTTGSGTFGSGEEFSEFVDLSKLGAVTTKELLMFHGRGILCLELQRYMVVC